MVTSLSGKEFAKGARNLLLLPESVNDAASASGTRRARSTPQTWRRMASRCHAAVGAAAVQAASGQPRDRTWGRPI